MKKHDAVSRSDCGTGAGAVASRRPLHWSWCWSSSSSRLRTPDSGPPITYDRTEQLLTETIKDSGLTTLYAFTYEYDGAGNRMRMIRDGGNTYYTYNKANELRTEFRGTEHAYFFYDGKGNTVRERQKDGFNRYYQYDADNMSTEVKYAPSGERTRLYFQYNALKERVGKTDWGAAGQDERKYSFDGIRKALIKEAAGSIERYIYGPSNIHGVSSPVKYTDLSSTASNAYHLNNVLSVIGLSDSAQSSSGYYLYNASGIILESSSTIKHMLRFSAKEYDKTISHYNYLFRDYYPNISRWGTIDPLLLVSNNTKGIYRHPYNYLANPLRYIDLLGLEKVCRLCLYVWFPEYPIDTSSPAALAASFARNLASNPGHSHNAQGHARVSLEDCECCGILPGQQETYGKTSQSGAQEIIYNAAIAEAATRHAQGEAMKQVFGSAGYMIGTTFGGIIGVFGAKTFKPFQAGGSMDIIPARYESADDLDNDLAETTDNFGFKCAPIKDCAKARAALEATKMSGTPGAKPPFGNTFGLNNACIDWAHAVGVAAGVIKEGAGYKYYPWGGVDILTPERLYDTWPNA